MKQSDPPTPRELELSLFGPGFGECVVVHLGFNRWMVVDSCLDRSAGSPVALRYLEQIGVDVAKRVVSVVVTHWHDDHIQGAAQIVDHARNAKVACSAALQKEEFFVLLNAARKEIKLVDHSSGVAEFSRILQILNARDGRHSPHSWAADGTILFEDAENGIEVRSLSPSAETIAHAAITLGNLVPVGGSNPKRIPESSPNDLSIVLLVRSPQASFLLGGDLETGNNQHRGWRAVVASAVRPQFKSIGFKVSHHGSHNGDFPPIWTDLLHAAPYALLTPYGRGKKPLPATEDVTRMAAQTNQLYSTVWPPTVTAKFPDKAVRRTVDEVVKDARATRSKPGHLRLRIPMDAGGASRELFDGAVCISQEHKQSPQHPQ